MAQPAVLGDTLVALREREAWSQEEAAKRIGVSRVTLGTWERGEARPRPEALQKVAEVYRVTPSDLQRGVLPDRPAGLDPVSFEAGRQAVIADLRAFLGRISGAGADPDDDEAEDMTIRDGADAGSARADQAERRRRRA